MEVIGQRDSKLYTFFFGEVLCLFWAKNLSDLALFILVCWIEKLFPVLAKSD